MNIILYEAAELTGGELLLRDRRADHVRRVIAPSVGDELRVGCVRGGRGTAVVRELAPDAIRLALGALGAPTPPPAAALLLAVPRPKSVPRIVAAAASLGVSRIDLTNAWRVDKSYLGAPALDPAALDLAARLGCEQGGHTWLPDLTLHPRLMPLLDSLPTGEIRLVAHPRAATPIEEASTGGRSLLAVGPERGWIDRELESFDERGFVRVRSVASVMRTETAVSVLLGQLELLQRRVGSERSKG